MLANYPLMTMWAPPAPLYPQRHPRGGRGCPGAPGALRGPELGAPAVRRIPAGWVSSSLCRGLGQAAILGLILGLCGSFRGLRCGCRKARARQPRSAQPVCRDVMGAGDALRFHGAEPWGDSSVRSSRWSRWCPMGFPESPRAGKSPQEDPGRRRARRLQNRPGGGAVRAGRGREGGKGREGGQGP